MKPAVPPAVVLVFTGLTQVEVAEKLEVSWRTFHRYLHTDWSGWKVRVAEAFCELGGVDFWNLSLDGDPAGAERLRRAFARVHWRDLSDDRIRKAVDALILRSGGKVSREVRVRLADDLWKMCREANGVAP